MSDRRESEILLTLDNLIAYHVLSPSIIHKMLGAYVLFEFDGTTCIRRQASASYLDLVMEKEKEETNNEKINMIDYVHKDERDYVLTGLRQCLEEEKAGLKKTLTYRYLLPNSRELWVRMEVFLINRGEHSSFFCGIFHDISETVRKSYELELLNREVYYLNNAVPVGYHRCADKPGCPFTYISNSFLNIVGYAREEIEELFDNQFQKMVHPLDRERLFQEGCAAQFSNHKKNMWMEYRIKCKGGYRWVFHQAELFDVEGCRFFQGTIIDITEREILREKLSTSMEAFRIASVETGNFVFTYNMETRTVVMNDESAKVLGMPPLQPDVPYHIVENMDIITEDSKSEYIRVHQAILNGERHAEGIIKLKSGDGKQNVYELKIQAVLDEEGKSSGTAVGVYNDITAGYARAMEQEMSLQTMQQEIVEKEEFAKEESRKQLDMIYALSLDYYIIYLLELETGTVTVQRKTELAEEHIMQTAVYAKEIEQYISQYVYWEDQEFVQKEISLETIRKRFMAGKTHTVRFRKLYKGTITYIEWRIVNFCGRDGALQVLIAVRNVDEEVKKELEQKTFLEEALERAQNANRAKTVFLSNMSHDIRTPMNAIVGLSKVAEENINDRQRVQECLKNIRISGNHLHSLFSDILDMSQIENGKMQIQEEECNLSDVMYNVVNMIQPQVKEKQMKFFFNILEIKDEKVCADPLRLQQMFLNILDNMVKFTPEHGMISIYVRQDPSAVKGYHAYEFIFRDTGIGMSEEFLERIYEPFEREKNTTDSGIEGTGLGMAIVKAIIDMMHGTIQVYSEQGKGTRYEIKIAFRQLEGRKTEEEKKKHLAKEGETSLANKRLLVVEDNFMNTEIAVELLEQRGFIVETAVNGSIAVQKVEESKENYYDAILMDIQMPVMDGYKATEAIRNLSRKDVAKVPIIAMTANALDEDKKQAMKSGMNAHLEKPLDIDKLYRVLEEYLL